MYFSTIVLHVQIMVKMLINMPWLNCIAHLIVHISGEFHEIFNCNITLTFHLRKMIKFTLILIKEPITSNSQMLDAKHTKSG